MRKTILIVLAFLICQFSTQTGFSQESDTIQKKWRRNIIRYNIGNAALFSIKTVIVGYERAIGKNKSFSVNFGSLKLPDFNVSGGKILSALDTKYHGYNFSGDFRFYLPKENKHKAPHGVYLAPYFSYNYFTRKTTFEVNYDSFQGQLTNEFALTITTLGAEVGYQFLIWNRFTIDLIVIGPGISNYKLVDELSTSFDPNEESELFKKINDVLSDKIPGYNLVIEPGEFEKDGTVNTTTIGYRYLIHIGIAF